MIRRLSVLTYGVIHHAYEYIFKWMTLKGQGGLYGKNDLRTVCRRRRIPAWL